MRSSGTCLGAVWLGALLAFAPAALALRPGTVRVRCPVAGAQVTVDGEYIGTVPVDPFQVRAGVHTVRVLKAGLIAFQKRFRIRPGQKLTVIAVAREQRALLTIETTERGGKVFLDGHRLGSLPVRQRPIEPGRHKLVILHRGLHPYRKWFRVKPFAEYVATPTLRYRNGRLAAGPDVGLGLDLGLASNPPGAKPPAGSDLDLSLAAPTAAAPPAKPATTAPGLLPAPPTLAERSGETPPSSAGFVAAAIPQPTSEAAAQEGDEEEEEPATPFFQRPWVWIAAAAVVVAGVAVPVALGDTGGYREVRNPDTACRGCLVVINQ